MISPVLAILFVSVVAGQGVPLFPLNKTVQEAFKALEKAKPPPPSNVSHTTYLETIKGIVDFFRLHQAADGSIIDPFEKKEIQYSTPCFANAAATLISSGYVKDADLLNKASLALTRSLTELATANCSQGHCNFFTMPAMFAYMQLKDQVQEDLVGKWKQLASSINPEKTYRSASNNWATVALTGEYMRYKLGFSNNTEWLENTLKSQMEHFTANGQYQDHSGYDGVLNPMPYDHFPRKYLAVMMEMGYNLSYADTLPIYLKRGALVSLLMQSPWGELPTGGRSSQHQWNEAVQTVTYEIYANKANKEGDVFSAGAFKRAAHLALESVRRWRISPAGELYIVKNRFDPKLRHGYEGYSYFSNYNLLPASMLATAFLYCNDSIVEGPSPAEVGGFVFEIPEFHKVFANSGGMYLEFETSADPHYDSTGLTRIHTPAVNPLTMPTAGSAQQSGPLSVSPTWFDDHKNVWYSVSQVGYVQKVNYSLTEVEVNQSSSSVSFSMTWILGDSFTYATVEEKFVVTPKKVQSSLLVCCRSYAKYLGYQFPAFLFDGQTNSSLQVDGTSVAVDWPGSQEVFNITDGSSSASGVGSLPVTCERLPQQIESRNGYLAPIRCVLQFDDDNRSKVGEPGFVRYEICPRPSKMDGTQLLHLGDCEGL